MQTIQSYIKDACEDMGEYGLFRNEYSGRGMYGRKCVGITGSVGECMAIIGLVIKNMTMSITALALLAGRDQTAEAQDKLADAENTFDNNVDALMNFNQDNMGMSGVILYWPDLEPVEEVEPEHDGQPDEAQEWHDFDPDC